MKNLSARTQGLIAINFAAVIFGSAALYGKLDLSPFWIVAMRGAFAAVAVAMLRFYKKDATPSAPRQWRIAVGSGLILAIHWLLFFASVQMAGVAVATLSFAAFPFFTVLIEAFHQKRAPHLAAIAAALAIVVAVGLLVHPEGGQGNIVGIAAGLGAALTFACFGYASKLLGKNLSPLGISFAQNATVALSLAPFLFFVGHVPSGMDWFWLAMLGLFTTAFMHQVYFYALRRLSASVCSGFVALEPVYAILFAAALFHAPITPQIVLSVVLIVGASLALLRLEPPS
ncbi:MAG: DMT family transporter [Alphaproteobacteria bacterium]|nr:DMT family transporter [Alphaproteobacteria bacterium]